MFRSSAQFDKQLDKATSPNNLEPDFGAIIQICDLIRQEDCTAKYALTAVKKKLFNSNAHTAHFALLVLESIVKNCGHVVHDEVATKPFMDVLRDVLKSTNSDPVKQKTLEIIQAWTHAFRNTPKYKAVQDLMTALKAEGMQFPVLKESDAMFAAEKAPEWVDAKECHRCRVPFSIVQRKHHCRACGNVFCGQCSGKTTIIPKFGIEKEVRVCDNCFDLNKNRASSPKVETEQLPVEYLSSSLAQQSQAPKQKTAEELKEEEDFNLALALSQSEAEAKEKKRPDITHSMQAVKITSPVKKEEYEQEDEELARYLNRSHWDQRAADTRAKSPEAKQNNPPSAPTTPTHQMENGLSDIQLHEFIANLRSQVEIFVNRMKSNSSRGRHISNDSSVQSMFMNFTENHSKLLHFITEQDEMRLHFEHLQDKLTQVKDAVAALDDLRNEHQEKLRREAEEAERIKQQQMAHKLDIMRKKKQDYLQQQRVIALQRLAEQNREMQMRKQEHQYPGYGMYPPNPGYSNQAPPVYPPNQPYMPAYPANVMHPGMGMPSSMQGPQSLPSMQQMQQQGMMPQQQISNPIPHALPQHMHPAMHNHPSASGPPQSLPQPTGPGMPHSIPQSAGPGLPHSISNHGLPTGMPVMPAGMHPGMALGGVNMQNQNVPGHVPQAAPMQGMVQQFQHGGMAIHSLPMQHPTYPGIAPGQASTAAGVPGNPVNLYQQPGQDPSATGMSGPPMNSFQQQPGQDHHYQQVRQAPQQDQATAELISFD